MKKLVVVTGIILMVCLFTQVYNAPTVPVEATQTSEYKADESEVYVLKAENGRLAVYIKGESTPYMITDTLIDTLPQSDILRLEKGIEVSGKDNLRKSLEDYCS